MGSGPSQPAERTAVNPADDIEIGTEADVELSSSEDDVKTDSEVSSEHSDSLNVIFAPADKGKWRETIRRAYEKRDAKLRQLQTLEQLVSAFQDEANYHDKEARMWIEGYVQKYDEYPFKEMAI